MSRGGEEAAALAELVSRLRARYEEIEQVTLARLTALEPLPDRAGPGYAEGLRAAIAAAVDHAIAIVEHQDDATAAIPLPLVLQARLAARSGVGVETVARRYVAGHSLIGEFVLQEAGGRLPPADVKRLVRRLGLAVDRLLHAATTAYNDEAESLGRGKDRVRLGQVEGLLAGTLLEVEALDYDLALNHVAVCASGADAEDTLRPLSRSLDARLLHVSPSPALHLAWLGRQGPLEPEAVRRSASAVRRPHACLGLGEAAAGPAGWRLTHRQAVAALDVGLHREPTVVRYADVALLAAALNDDVLESSLKRLYLEPLEVGGERGKVLRETLRAYFAADCNVSSAASALEANRNTVAARLREVEKRLGRPLSRSRPELDVALGLPEAASAAAAAARR